MNRNTNQEDAMISLDYQLAHSAGVDAANRQMRAAGRRKWSVEDYNLAAQTMNALLDKIKGTPCYA